MTDTREKILKLGETLIREQGYDGFSYHDISASLGIKNAAVHYYFPKKSDLGIAILKITGIKIEELKKEYQDKTALEKLKTFIKVYVDSYKHGRICLIGALASSCSTKETALQKELKIVVDSIADTVTEILKEGRKKKEFNFSEDAKTKALLVVSNLLAALQLERISHNNEFVTIRDAVIKDLTQK